jgi:hypothetical protein
MKTVVKNQKLNSQKKVYKSPVIERIALDTEIALVMVSVPPNPSNAPQMPEGWVQKIFKFRL